MSKIGQETIATLNNLMRTSKDVEQGFRFAGDHAKSADLKRLLRILTLRHRQFSIELHVQVCLLGGKPDETPGIVSALQRGWMYVRPILLRLDDDSIISECERVENAAIQEYEKALESTLMSDDVRALLWGQYATMKQARDRILGLARAISA